MASTTIETVAASTSVPAPESDTQVVKFEVIFDKLHFVQNLIKEIQTQLKTASKSINKAIKKESNNKRKGRKASTSSRAPGGFAKPTQLSETMSAFLGIDNGTMVPRTEVTKRINDYIKTNNLQNARDKRIINPDAQLLKLLSPPEEGKSADLTYFTLQSRIKHHFVKQESA